MSLETNYSKETKINYWMYRSINSFMCKFSQHTFWPQLRAGEKLWYHLYTLKENPWSGTGKIAKYRTAECSLFIITVNQIDLSSPIPSPLRLYLNSIRGVVLKVPSVLDSGRASAKIGSIYLSLCIPVRVSCRLGPTIGNFAGR